jgi:hypothetical protein
MKMKKYGKKLSLVPSGPIKEQSISPKHMLSGNISIFVITVSQVTILLFLLISDELFFALFYPLHLLQ